MATLSPAQSLGGNWQAWPGAATDISIGANGSMWVVGNVSTGGGYQIFSWNGSGWTWMPGGAVRIAVDPSGSPWVVNSMQQIFHWNGSGWTWISGSAYDVGVGPNGTVDVIGTGASDGGYGIWQWNGGGWTSLPGAGLRIAVDGSGYCWVVNNYHQIWHQTTSGGGFVREGMSATDVGVGSTGDVWEITNQTATGGFEAAHWDAAGSVWDTLDDHGGLNITVNPAGRPFITDSVDTIYQRAGYSPPNPVTNLKATAGAGVVTVTWTAPAANGAGPINSYQVTPIENGAAGASLTVAGGSTGANVPNRLPGASEQIRVVALNAYGSSSAVTSNTVTVGGLSVGAGLGDLLYLDNPTSGGITDALYSEGWWTSSTNSMNVWTVEGYIGGMARIFNNTATMAWGVLSPNGGTPSGGAPQAGLQMAWHESSNVSSFYWPGNHWDIPSNADGVPSAATGTSPAYFAEDYDGSFVRGYINGSLVLCYPYASSSSPATCATQGVALASVSGQTGFLDHTDLSTGAFDEFRVSNVARYTGSTMTPPSTEFQSDSNTQVLLHFDDHQGKLPGVTLWVNGPSNPTFLASFRDSSGNGRNAQLEAWLSNCANNIYCNAGQGAELIQPFALSYGITNGEQADECAGVDTGSGAYCQQFKDLSVPGRGVALSEARTYNSYDAAILGRFGYGWSDTYSTHLTIDGSGNVTVHDPKGGAAYFADRSGTYVPPSYNSSTLTLAGGAYTLADKQGEKEIFNSSGQLTQQLDRNGYVTALAYSGSALSTVTDPAGRKLTFAYGSNGLVASVTDGVRTVGYGYDGSQNLTSVTDVLNGGTQLGYDSAHHLTSLKDPVCVQTTGCTGMQYTYVNGQVTQELDAYNKATNFSYSSTGWTFSTTVTDPLGNQTIYDYGRNLPMDTTHAYGTSLAATTTYTYDNASMGATTITNPNGETGITTYDSKGNPLTKADPQGNQTVNTYNSFSEPLTIKDALGVTTTNTYDGSGNLLTTSTPLIGTTSNQVTSYAYGDLAHPGDVTSETDPSNRTTTYTYDSYGDRASATDGAGDKTTYVYDSLGRMTSSVSPLGNVSGGNPASYTTSYTYNGARQPLTITDPLNHHITDQYDADGHLTQSIDADGNVTITSYDLNGRPTSTTAGYGTPQATTRTVNYDADGNVLSQVDGLTHTLVASTYDALGRVKTRADGLSRTRSYAYDAANRLASVVDPMNQTATYIYDDTGRLTNAGYMDGRTPSESYTYDADGQQISMTDGSGSSTETWDSLHRLTQEKNGAGSAVSYTYDPANRLLTIAYPGTAGTVARAYDNAGRLHTVQDWLSHTTTFSYDANSNLTGVAYPNGVVGAWSYNHADQLTNISDLKGGATLLRLPYTRDSNGQITSESSTSFGYNSLDQLTSGAGQSYSYDAAGRVTQNVSGSTTTNFSYDNADELTSTAVAGGATTNYGYDADGRRTASGSTSLTWNQQDQLVSYGSGATYAYDGAGNRTTKTAGGTTDRFLWDNAEGLPLLLEDNNTEYVTGPGGLPLEQISGGSTVYYYLRDQLGSTRALTDSTGAVVATDGYDAYGNITSQSGSVSNPFLFAGQFRDAESGLYYLRARYYDPATAQFLSVDPKVASTWAPYAYTSNNPVNSTDPSGLDSGCLGCDALNWLMNTAETVANTPVPPALQEIMNGAAYSFNGGLKLSTPQFMLGEFLGGAALIGMTVEAPEDLLALRVGEEGLAFGAEAAAADRAPEVGEQVFRVWGRTPGEAGSGAWGRYWTRIDPRTVEGYRAAAGLPEQNAGRFLSIGRLRSVKGVDVTEGGAAPLGGLEGGIDEIRVPYPGLQITLEDVIGLNPDF